MFENSYEGKTVIVTGHTGFKGSWISSWLNQLGANVFGVSFDPVERQFPTDFSRLLRGEKNIDIASNSTFSDYVADVKPDLIFHLAAQSLVRKSYIDPEETWKTNVLGTLNVLEAIRRSPGVKGSVLATTDKVYANNQNQIPFKESDPLGGHDPYSASKAAMEILIDSYRKSYFSSGNETSQIISSARAGNVIGGGDWNEDRLIPDVIRSSANHRKLEIRNPLAVRPWQYVLDCLSGYLYLGKLILSGDPRSIGSWNFGPNPKDFLTVLEILGMVNEQLNLDYKIENVSPDLHEAQSLTLDSTKAKNELGWSPVLSANESVVETIDWYKEYKYLNYENSKIFLDRYFSKAKTAKARWIM